MSCAPSGAACVPPPGSAGSWTSASRSLRGRSVTTDLLSRVRTGSWLDAQTFPPLSWAVPGIVPEGFGLLTGPPKVGKSWLTLGLVLAVASGGVALGKVPTGYPRPVLLLALEDGDRRLQARCRTLLGDEPIPALLHYATRATAAEILDILDGWLAEHGHARPLVVLDTLGKVSPPAMPGESAYGRDYRIGGALKARADAHPGTALLVVHHVRKAAGEDWMDSTSGTNGLNGSADFTVSLSRARNDTEGVLRVTGRDVPEGEYAITVAEGTWTLRGSSLAEAAQAAQQAKAAEGLGDRSCGDPGLRRRAPRGCQPHPGLRRRCPCRTPAATSPAWPRPADCPDPRVVSTPPLSQVSRCPNRGSWDGTPGQMGHPPVRRAGNRWPTSATAATTHPGCGGESW